MNEKLDALLRGRKFKKLADHVFKTLRNEYGLKQIEIEILFFLYNNPDASSSEIYRDLTLHKGHVSMAMVDLCRKGYLRSSQNKADRRYVIYEMTGRGKTVADQIAAKWIDMREKLFFGVSDEELETAKHILGKISNNIDVMCGE